MREVWELPKDPLTELRRLRQEVERLKRQVSQGEACPVFTINGTPGSSFFPGPRHLVLHDYVLTHAWAAVDQAASVDIEADLLVNGSSALGAGALTIPSGEFSVIATPTLLEVHRGDYVKVAVLSGADEVDWTIGLRGFRTDSGEI